MSSINPTNRRVLSGMRPTGRLHLGHYHGVIKNWIDMQYSYDCFFFVADWHALTTGFDSSEQIEKNVWDMAIDWLACGVEPGAATLFIQSRVPEHAELHLLLSMVTPLSWLERIPSYKDQQQALKEKDLSSYGFLGYPLLQSADILAYQADYVPVGEDQVAHVEFTREVARRFNYIFGRDENFAKKAEAAIVKLGGKQEKLYRDFRKAFLEQGNQESLGKGQALIEAASKLTLDDKDRLLGYLENAGKIILTEPQSKLTKASKMPGLDGRKMSKSYHNTISLRDEPKDVEKKIKTMPTDPARVKRTDPGDPEKCPVWSLHKVYSNEDVQDWVQTGCKNAGIGCIDCKKPIIDSVLNELKPIQQRAQEYEENHSLVRNIIMEGSEVARDEAKKTLAEVRSAIGVDYR